MFCTTRHCRVLDICLNTCSWKLLYNFQRSQTGYKSLNLRVVGGPAITTVSHNIKMTCWYYIAPCHAIKAVLTCQGMGRRPGLYRGTCHWAISNGSFGFYVCSLSHYWMLFMVWQGTLSWHLWQWGPVVGGWGLVCNKLENTCQGNIHISARTQRFQAEHPLRNEMIILTSVTCQWF